jgi:Fur family ferric uptake transcriptional regulator
MILQVSCNIDITRVAQEGGVDEKSTRGFEEVLRDAGLRITRPRKAILRLLCSQGDHPDAVEIYRRAKEADASVSLATVYRTMKVLQDKGAIRRLTFEGGPSRFEAANRAHHDHIVDVETGQVIEFRSEEIERLQEEIANELGYEIVSHRLELYARRRKRKGLSK